MADGPYRCELTSSRTETVQAYRAASREFYKQAGIKHYVWHAVLDPRTCAICWSLHGRIFPSKKKVYGHVNCRCALIPVTKGMREVETGADRFARLEPGFQKQILGPKRFELYQGGTGLNDFIGSRNTKEFGTRHFIRGLAELESAKGGKAKGHFFPIDEKILAYTPKGAIQGQQQTNSCVSASVRMILNDHGLDEPEAHLRVELETGRRGTELSRAAKALNERLGGDKYRFERNATLEKLSRASGPSIVNVRTEIDAHSLVVDRVTDKFVYLRDPLPVGRGKSYALTLETFKKYFHFKGKVHGLAVIIKSND